MLGAVMAEIVAVELPEHDAIRAQQAGGVDFRGDGPPGRAKGLGVLGLPRPPDRHADRDGDGDEAA